MGCDIHIEIEYRNKAGVWQPVHIEPQARWLIEQHSNWRIVFGFDN